MIVMAVMDEKSAQYKQGSYSVKTYNHSVMSKIQQNFIRFVTFNRFYGGKIQDRKPSPSSTVGDDLSPINQKSHASID
jgi:hypothetical protein